MMKPRGKRLASKEDIDTWLGWVNRVLLQHPLQPYGPKEPKEQERYVLEVFQEALMKIQVRS